MFIPRAPVQERGVFLCILSQREGWVIELTLIPSLPSRGHTFHGEKGEPDHDRIQLTRKNTPAEIGRTAR